MKEALDGWGVGDAPSEGYISEGEINIQKLVASQNRKKKKPGGFQSMGLSHFIVKGILKKGYTIPTPIQRKTIPLILDGKDVVAMARTGSGKTAAFLIPMFEKLKVHSAKVGARALILSPTRELALQTLNFAKALGRFTDLRAACILGGESIEVQFAALHENPDIIIATPKRFKHICIEMSLKLDSVQYVVFDEVDRLFEMHFTDQMNYILNCLPQERQTLLFSATLPKIILEFAKIGLTDPILIRLDVDTKISEDLKLGFFQVNSDDKLPLLLYFLKNVILECQQTVVFVPTKHHVEYIHQILEKANISNTYIYSSLDAAARKVHMAKFRARKSNILIVTDVAARGLDVPLLDVVINYNFPTKAKLFVHRVGRVARCGRMGTAYSFVAPDESPYLLELHMFLNRSIKLAPFPLPEGKELDWDRMYGRVPQEIINDNTDYVSKLHFGSYDLQMLQNSANNSFKKYMKSRPASMPETNRRLKEELWNHDLGLHPLLVTSEASQSEEIERQNLLEKLKNIRPKMTIFEIRESKKGGKTSKDNFMVEKRRTDSRKIEAFHQKMQGWREAKKKKLKEEFEAELQRQNLSKSKEEDILKSFNAVIGKAKKTRHRDREKKVQLSATTVSSSSQDQNQFIPYYSGDIYADRGYSLLSNFQRDTTAASFDLMGDEDKALSCRHQTKWDRKRKKFVGIDNPKKIQTESGVWVEASYKKDLYEKWKQKMVVENEEEGEAEDEEMEEPNDMKKQPRKGGRTFVDLSDSSKGRPHPLLKGKKVQRIKPQKKGPQQLKSLDQRMKFLRDKVKMRKRMKDIQRSKEKRKNGKRRVRKY